MSHVIKLQQRSNLNWEIIIQEYQVLSTECVIMSEKKLCWETLGRVSKYAPDMRESLTNGCLQ